MASDVTVSYGGLTEIMKALDELPRVVEAGIIGDALIAGAEVLRGSMSRRAPRDPHVAPPTLAEDIGIEVEIDMRKGIAVAHIGPEKQVFYGTFVELGTSKMAARPFMRPAVDEDGAAAVAAFAAHAKAGIEVAWDRMTARNAPLVKGAVLPR